ncbi:DUF5719 family protein [Leucobacter sp. M11]|uniref:DUF5719 family protein n=1 Tax=Leucobacter sp. M11 TaxID=2993565 RepID=UPI002D7ECE22|nr:DUF5719 family protein [Leucobacter sp. M11]MEB4615445.1 DUF5719 family protein [Leucobacter sp. M11]
MTSNRTETVTRIGVGILGTAAIAAGVFVSGIVTLPTTTVPPAKTVVDTARESARQLVCAGSLLDLGVDPAQPDAAVPAGAVKVAAAGTTADRSDLARERPSASGGAPSVMTLTGPESELSALAQSQRIDSERLSGFSATACGEAASEQWLVGGDTMVGSLTTISVSNPGQVTATVSLRVFTEDGEVESLTGGGLIIPAGEQRTVSVNGLAPDAEQISALVESRGAPVTATLQVARTDVLRANGVDTTNAQVAPSRTVLIPGIITPKANGLDDVDAHGHVIAPVTVRVLAPGTEGGFVSVTGIQKDGTRAEVARVPVEPGVVQDLVVEELGTEATSIEVSSDVRVVAAARLTAEDAESSDLAWLTPAPVFDADAPVSLAVAEGPAPQLTLVAPGAAEATVTLTPEDTGKQDDARKPVTVRVPAGASVTTGLGSGVGYRIESDEPIAAGVTYGGDGQVSGYPVLPAAPRAASLTVFTR